MKFSAVVCVLLAAALYVPSDAGFLHRGLFGRKPAPATTAPPAAASSAAKDDDDDDDGVPSPTADTTVATADASATVDTAAPALAADAGAESSFPTLPAVEAITGTSAETLKSLNSQASVLEARIQQVQMENEQKLSRQKSIFEARLKDQETANRQVVGENDRITKDISNLKDGNSKLRKHAEELAEGNRLKRAELRTLQAKLGISTDFIVGSLKATSDKDVQELAVLSAKAPVVAAVHTEAVHADKKALKEADEDAEKEDEKDEDEEKDTKDDDKDDDEKDDDKEESFVQVRSRTRRMHRSRMDANAEEGLAEIEADLGTSQEDAAPALVIPNKNPRDLLNVLSSGVDSLAKQEKASDAKLKTMFVTAFKKGTKRHQALLAEQKSLNATSAQLGALQTKLKAAEVHLEGRRDSLKERLRGLGLFLQRLGHMALAPSSEASKLMKGLPDAVTPQKAPDASAAAADTSDSADAAAATSS